MDLQERPPSSGAFSFDSDTLDAAEAARVSASALDRLDENLRCKSQMAATCVKQEVVDPRTGEVTKVITGFTFCNHRYNDLEIAELAREAWRDFHGTDHSTFDWPEYKDINFVEGPAAIGLQVPSQNTDDDMELSFEGCDADFKNMKKITQYNVRQECINQVNVTSNMDVSVEESEIRENDRSDEKHQEPLKLSQDDLHLDILGKEKVETIQNSAPVSCISTNLDLQKQNSKVCITKNSVYFCSNPYNTMNVYPINQNTEGNITGRVENFDSIQYNLIDLDRENKNPDVSDSGRNFYPDSYNFVDLCPQNKTAYGEGPGNRCACYKLPEFNGKTSSLEYTQMEQDCVSIPSVINGDENTVEDRIVNAFSRKFCMNKGVNDNGHDNNKHVEDTASPLKQVDEFCKCRRPDNYSQASHSYSNEKVQNDRLVPRNLMDVLFVKYESEASKAGGTKTPESEDQDVICIGVRGEDLEDICGDSIKETFKSKVNESFEALLSMAKGNAEDENMPSEIDRVDSVSEVVRKRMCSDEPEIKKKKIDDIIKTDMDEIQGKKYHMDNWLSTMVMGSSSWCQQSPEEKRSWRKEKRHE